MKDRNNGYTPDWPAHRGEPGPGRPVEVMRPHPQTGELRLGSAHLGLADELNRESSWWWAEVGGNKTIGDGDDGPAVDVEGAEHWSHFEGHFVQIDIQFSTFNDRTVNAWKGRDEIRKAGEWRLFFNRLGVFSGTVYDPLEDLLRIREVIKKLLDHAAFHLWTEEEIAGLVGRKVWYERTPAVVSAQYIEDEGRIVLIPEPGLEFQSPPYTTDEADRESWVQEYGDEMITTLLDAHIWWWRD